MKVCEICRGAGMVRFPIYRRATITSRYVDSPSIEESSRSYPCPECAPTIPEERLAVVQYHSWGDSQLINEPGYAEASKRRAIHELAELIFSQGFVRFERGPDDGLELGYPMRATIGVVAPKRIATLEQRISEHQEELARDVAENAAADIANWGVYFGALNISKDMAIGFVRSALKRVLAKRAEMRPASTIEARRAETSEARAPCGARERDGASRDAITTLPPSPSLKGD